MRGQRFIFVDDLGVEARRGGYSGLINEWDTDRIK